MLVEILSPEKKLFAGEVISAQFPGTTGSFQVLKNHAAMIASIKQGNIVLKTDSGVKTFSVTGGFVEVLNNHVNVLIEGTL
ncbi:MAG: F0F1 ATP synthase subunit epsilon [Bacteroidetes bacterium]|nr:F0F1 ATP synthase subunit epsilon [Bacteroidota bacterium]MBP7399225.1 F0F1 ATP synthase subunit epsilon [Chitinophagales bacterium]MBK7108868.1 F0F1 ATP synthase subunit epsilon [Bacteroidota bacterium]MBK8488804.1 F0F1 ATP synthase subunit epsilon [Bacteroidota bacterium]MBK8681438.1 F0F1 ATP synthase subunit epsilon [Bacteroidota bacterium]